MKDWEAEKESAVVYILQDLAVDIGIFAMTLDSTDWDQAVITRKYDFRGQFLQTGLQQEAPFESIESPGDVLSDAHLEAKVS